MEKKYSNEWKTYMVIWEDRIHYDSIWYITHELTDNQRYSDVQVYNKQWILISDITHGIDECDWIDYWVVMIEQYQAYLDNSSL